jgi:hypothetical protein
MNMRSGGELRKRYFAALREKNQVDKNKSYKSESVLFMILRKADLDIPITDLEFQWLSENRYFEAIEIIALQQYQSEEKKRLEAEFLQLRTKYYIPQDLELPLSSSVYSILWKLDVGYSLATSEIQRLNEHGLTDTINLIKEVLNFSNLKDQYKATKNISQLPEEPLYTILKKLDAREQLSESEAEWLLELDFKETLEVSLQQERERKAEIEFSELKSKYQVDFHPDTSISSPLYAILKKLNIEQELDKKQCQWLKKQKLSELISIDEELKNQKLFVKLKDKYKATQYQSSNPSSRLFSILKNFEISQLKSSNSRELELLAEDEDEDEEFPISENDIQWLSEQGLDETVKIAQKIHFKALKNKYRIVGQLPLDPFYEIMLKLEREERLDPKQVVQLIEESQLSGHGKIAIAYYRLEAIFYEKEYQRTGNRWNLPSASSNWRKAEEPKKALKVTENINWKKVQASDLKSALWVTRGAAFRDLAQLDQAENCAKEAMESHPDSHQPYTLMGAICYDRSEYADGDIWFQKAMERGANDTDDEIEKIVRMTKDKDKRIEVVMYLLKKDPNRYAWANSYLK